jgi:Uma2 family endonuclease
VGQRAACYDRHVATASQGPAPPHRSSRNFSRREYDKMIDAGILGEDEHVELVAGRIVEMSPEGPLHAGTIDLCAEILRRLFGADYTVRVQHPLVVDPDGEPEPDLAVVKGGPREHLADHPREAVLVVEVAESSLEYDRREKALLYARAGFPEYWIVNLRARAVEVHRDPAPDGYRTVSSLGADAAISPLEAGAIVRVGALLP